MVEQVPRAVRDYGPENLGPGDVIVTNDPFPSGVHLNDVSLISPVHHEGELLGYVANLAHHVDVGGGAPASIGAFREVFQEGVIIPPVKARRGGADRRRTSSALDPRADPLEARDGAATCARRSRRTRPACGGCRRSSTRHGRETLAATMDELLAYTERRTRAELAALPHGVYEAEGSVDADGYTDEPVRLRARVEISADGVRFDLAGSDPQRRAPVNSTYAQTFSACAYARQVPDRPRPARERRLLPARLACDAPRGTVDELHVAEPGRRRLGDADAARRRDLPRAAAGAARAAARGDEGDDVPRGLRRRRPATRRVLLLPRDVRRRLRRPLRERRPRRRADARPEHRERAGRGDRAELPGAGDAALAGRGLRAAPGRFRGGLGLRKDFLFDRPTTFTVLADRTLRGPWGVSAGSTASVAEYVLVRGGEETAARREDDARAARPATRSATGRAAAAATARPRERDPERVLRDVLEGKVSTRARDVYGVVVEGRSTRWRRGCAVGSRSRFEVIRNALVAATDEMVLALKRSAYSTNIKTRSDFSCAFFDAELRAVAQGFAQPVHLGSMVEQVPKAVRAYGAGEPRARRRDRHERPVSRAACT